MITAASFLYMAYIMCDDEIQPSERDTSARDFETSDHFRKYFMSFGDYSLEFDLDGDPHYDASGLGRLHRFGAPSAICMSGSCPSEPRFNLGGNALTAFSICPAIKREGRWITSADVKHAVTEQRMSGYCAYCALDCNIVGEAVRAEYTITEKGVDIKVSGEGTVGLMLPAFDFDGENYTEISADANSLSVKYEGYVCRYETDGLVEDIGTTAYNRNGHYRCFAAFGKNMVNVIISVNIL